MLYECNGLRREVKAVEQQLEASNREKFELSQIIAKYKSQEMNNNTNCKGNSYNNYHANNNNNTNNNNNNTTTNLNDSMNVNKNDDRSVINLPLMSNPPQLVPYGNSNTNTGTALFILLCVFSVFLLFVSFFCLFSFVFFFYFLFFTFNFSTYLICFC